MCHFSRSQFSLICRESDFRSPNPQRLAEVCSKPFICQGKELDWSTIDCNICSSLLEAGAGLFRKACLLVPHLGLTTTLWSNNTVKFGHFTEDAGVPIQLAQNGPRSWVRVSSHIDLPWTTVGLCDRFSRSPLGHCSVFHISRFYAVLHS